MKADLVPFNYKKANAMRIRIFGCLLIISIFLFGIISICFRSVILFLALFCPIIMMFAYQYVIGKKTDKICQSSAYFSEDKIQVITNEGECYREILYSDIVGIRREDIVTMAVSLSAYNTKAPHLEAKYQYICLFMGNQNELPSTGLDFYKNFYQKDFFPIVYSQDAWDFLSDRISMVSENINKKTDT